eukprot:2225032-Pyramimonas_sp.AAC.1
MAAALAAARASSRSRPNRTFARFTSSRKSTSSPVDADSANTAGLLEEELLAPPPCSSSRSAG